MGKQKAVLDANVLYDGFLRDLLLSIFAAKMYEAKWTEKITREWVGHLLKNRSTVFNLKNHWLVDWNVRRHCVLPAKCARFLRKGRLGHEVAGNVKQVVSTERERFQRCKYCGDFGQACEAVIAWQG